jgi:hypothetical protein
MLSDLQPFISPCRPSIRDIANCFTPEHLRLTKSLAVAAAAILNARLYEGAKVYGAELEKRTSDLQEAQSALQTVQE